MPYLRHLRRLMDANNVLSALGGCYSALKTTDGDAIARATEWLTALYAERESVGVLIAFVNSGCEVGFRKQAIIGLSKAIGNVWRLQDDENRERLFTDMLQIIAREDEWHSRQLMIDVVRTIMEVRFEGVVARFIGTLAGSLEDRHLEGALLTASLISTDVNNREKCEEVFRMVAELLQRGFNSQDPRLCVAAFHNVLNSKLFVQCSFFTSFPGSWVCVMKAFDVLAAQDFDVSRICDLFAKAVEEKLPPEFPGDLLLKCLSFYAPLKATGRTALWEPVSAVVCEICRVYADEVVSSGAILQVLTMYFDWAVGMFNVDDSYEISEATVFEPIVSSLCKNEETVAKMWDMCERAMGTIPGKFIMMRSIGKTIVNADNFYRPRMESVVGLLSEALACDSLLMREGAAKTIPELMIFYALQKEEFAIEIFPRVFKACTEALSTEMLVICTLLMEAMCNTDDIFDAVFAFLSNCVKTETVDIKYQALKCLVALAHGSTLKFSAYSARLVRDLVGILAIDVKEAAILKTPVVDCLAQISKTMYERGDADFDAVVPELVGILSSHLESDDLELVVACLNAIEMIMICHQNAFAPLVEALIPKLVERSSFDVSAAYVRSLTSLEPVPASAFCISGVSLRSLARVVKMYSCHREGLCKIVVGNCEMHKSTESTRLKVAVTAAVTYLAEAVSPNNVDEIDVVFVRKLCQILVYMFASTDIEVQCAILRSMASIIAGYGWFDVHDYVLSFISRAKEIIECIDVTTYRPLDNDNDVFEALFQFVDTFCYSAGEQAPRELESLIPVFVGLAASENVRFRSLCVRYLGTLVAWGRQQSITERPTSDMLKFALMMAENDVDYAPFWALTIVIRNARKSIGLIGGQVYNICMRRLKETHGKSERVLRFKDNCLSCLIVLVSRFIRENSSWDCRECFPVILDSLPLQVDFENSPHVFNFLASESTSARLMTEFVAPYFKVLVLLLSSSDAVLTQQMKITHDYVRRLTANFMQIYSRLGSPERMCAEALQNDALRLQILKQRIGATT